MAAVALDTSVVIPALVGWHEHHPSAFTFVRDALVGEGGVVIPLPGLIEAYAVLTRLPAPWRLRPEDAHRLLVDTFRGKVRVVGLDGDQAWHLLLGAVATGVSGGATYDAHIAACARAAGAKALATFNRRHFERLDLGEMALIVPAEPGARRNTD